ncbi:MAG: extracellular solute-binding protein [Chloroflexi bacterium]|nr:extracellular solute-binding protein [Chloroflexota bacterium]
MREQVSLARQARLIALVVIIVATLMACSSEDAPPQNDADSQDSDIVVLDDRIQITWFIGLGAGSREDQLAPQEEWVEIYNNSQDRIELLPVVVDNELARDALREAIEAGNPPDIVGPVGTVGRGDFPGAFLDLQPLVDEFDYDLSDIDPAFLDFYREEGALVGLPFAIFPSALFYNRDHFDAAGLNYPPQAVGEPYLWPDGTEAIWDFDTVAELAALLTLDENGNNATDPDFDAAMIVQYGFDFQWTRRSPRWFSAYFEPFYPVDEDGQAALSDGQVEAIQWFHSAIWGEQPFLPAGDILLTDEFGDNGFSAGRVAMGLTHLWYTCCIDSDNVPSWDVAVAPSYNGDTTAKMHGDTFAIMATTEHPREAFEVYTYMLGEGSSGLYEIYGGLPARIPQQDSFFETLDERFAPNEVNWQVFIEMISYLDVPNHELALPNTAPSHDAFITLGTELSSTPDLDVDDRIELLLDELDALYAEGQ